jgi:hypothetical protein
LTIVAIPGHWFGYQQVFMEVGVIEDALAVALEMPHVDGIEAQQGSKQARDVLFEG